MKSWTTAAPAVTLLFALQPALASDFLSDFDPFADNDSTLAPSSHRPTDIWLVRTAPHPSRFTYASYLADEDPAFDPDAPPLPPPPVQQPPENRKVFLILDILPSTSIISPDLDNIVTEHNTGSFINITETYDVPVSIAPNVKLGAGINFEHFYVDLTGGIGYLFGAVTRSPFATGEVAVRFKIGEHVTLGPRVAIYYFFDPEWESIWEETESDGSILLDETAGYAVGFTLTAGKPLISFSMSVDFFSAAFDVEGTTDGWTISETELDFTGLMFNFGLMMRF